VDFCIIIISVLLIAFYKYNMNDLRSTFDTEE